ncbi:hypothetical protein EAF04_009895 [Stromatinia cepivora]|nr:hypothetical protein EAF04_009895 [Stromatinia cepivora]
MAIGPLLYRGSSHASNLIFWPPAYTLVALNDEERRLYDIALTWHDRYRDFRRDNPGGDDELLRVGSGNYERLFPNFTPISTQRALEDHLRKARGVLRRLLARSNTAIGFLQPATASNLPPNLTPPQQQHVDAQAQAYAQVVAPRIAPSSNSTPHHRRQPRYPNNRLLNSKAVSERYTAMGSAPPRRHPQAYGTAPTGLNRTGENRQALVGHSYQNPQYSHHGPSTPVDQPTANSIHPGFNRSRENGQAQVGDFGQPPPRRSYGLWPSWSPRNPLPAFAQRTAMQDQHNYRILPTSEHPAAAERGINQNGSGLRSIYSYRQMTVGIPSSGPADADPSASFTVSAQSPVLFDRNQFEFNINGFSQPPPEQPVHFPALAPYPVVPRPWTNNSLSTPESPTIAERTHGTTATAESPKVTGRSRRHQYIYDNSRLATLDDLLGTPPLVRSNPQSRYQGSRTFSSRADAATSNQQTPAFISAFNSSVVVERSNPQNGRDSQSMHSRRRQMTMNIPPSGPRRRPDESEFATTTVSSQPSLAQLISPSQQSSPPFSLTKHAVEVMSQLQDRQQHIKPHSPSIDESSFSQQNRLPVPSTSLALSIPAISAEARMMSALQSLNSHENESDSRDNINTDSKPNTKIGTDTTDTSPYEPFRFQSWLDRQPPTSNLRSTSTSTSTSPRSTRSVRDQMVEQAYALDTEESDNMEQYRDFSGYQMPDLWDHMRRSGYGDLDREAR